VAEHGLCRRVEILDPAHVIDNDHGIHHGVDQRLLLDLAGRQRLLDDLSPALFTVQGQSRHQHYGNRDHQRHGREPE